MRVSPLRPDSMVTCAISIYVAGPRAEDARAEPARAGPQRQIAGTKGMAGYPLIDIYCHIFPERFFQEMIRVAPNLTNIGQRLRNVKKLFDLDLRFGEMDQYGDYRQVISLPNPPIEDLAGGETGLPLP